MVKSDLKLDAPTLNTLTMGVFKYIANHPLIINPKVYHPITKEPIFISKYRIYDGQIFEGGLICSVFAEQPKSAAIFEPYDLGDKGFDLATFFINVKYSYNDLTIGNIEKNPNLIEVPSWSEYGLGQSLLTSNTKKDVILEINPGIQIIQDYLQVTKYIIDDAQYFKDFPVPIKSLQILNQIVKTKRWEQDDTIYFQEGQTLIRFDAYIIRGWRDKLNPLYLSEVNINPSIN